MVNHRDCVMVKYALLALSQYGKPPNLEALFRQNVSSKIIQQLLIEVEVVLFVVRTMP